MLAHPEDSNRKVALKFNLAHSTVDRYLRKKKNGEQHKAPGRTPGLTPATERRLYEILLFCSDRGAPLSIEEVRHLVKDYYDANGLVSKTFRDNFPGPTWAGTFLRKFPALTVRVAQNKRRAEGRLTKEDLEDYFRRIKPKLQGLPRSRLLNMDETRVTMDV